MLTAMEPASQQINELDNAQGIGVEPEKFRILVLVRLAMIKMFALLALTLGMLAAPVTANHQKENVISVASASALPMLVTVDPAKQKCELKKEQRKKKSAAHHPAKPKPKHHKSNPPDHHKSSPHHHHAPQKISGSHGPLHLTSPPHCG